VALAPVLDRCSLISFDANACRSARTTAGVQIGWVLDDDPNNLKAELEDLRPEFVFCDHRRLPAGQPLKSGSWSWVVYEVTDAGLALELHARGVGMVESMAPFRLAEELAGRDRPDS
jgi:glycerophosphoryl diester phosphodiesterase